MLFVPIDWTRFGWHLAFDGSVADDMNERANAAYLEVERPQWRHRTRTRVYADLLPEDFPFPDPRRQCSLLHVVSVTHGRESSAWGLLTHGRGLLLCIACALAHEISLRA